MDAAAGGDGLHPAGDTGFAGADAPAAGLSLWPMPLADIPAAKAAAPRRHQRLTTILLGDSVLVAALVSGMTLMLLAAFLRRRHRRRLGWGMLPDRSWFGRDGDNGLA